jgi:hypothetical protein
MSEALLTTDIDDVDEIPAKLRLMAAVSPGGVEIEVTPDAARRLAAVIDRGFQSEVMTARARQHVAEAELLARLWAAMAVAACAVAAVILLLRA